MKNSILVVMITLFCLVCIPFATATPLIEYSLTNIAGNTWQYDYYMKDVDLTADQMITIYFDKNYYSEITPTNYLTDTDWFIQELQPDPAIWGGGEDGSYNAVALIDNPAYTGPFSVQFNWLDTFVSPGSQFFEVFDANMDTIGSGMTVLENGPDAPVVPEPASGLLLLGGLGLLAGVARLRQRRGNK